MMPGISIIVPFYKVEKYLRRCVDSILAQTFTDFELLLVDDGSPDNSGKICDEYAVLDPRVRVFHKPNGGVSSARNLGLDNAQEEWVTFVDADDWIEEKFFSDAMDKAYKEDADMVFFDLKIIYDRETQIFRVYEWSQDGKEGLKEYISTPWTVLCANLAKRSLFDGLRIPENISYCEDFNAIVKVCCKAKKIIKINTPYYNYRQHSSSIMHNLDQKSMQDEIWSYFDVISFFKSNGDGDAFEKCMSWRMLKATQSYALEGSSFDLFKKIPGKKKAYLGVSFYWEKTPNHHVVYL